MKAQELQTRLTETKAFLNREIVRNKTRIEPCMLNLHEIGAKMDMIHEAERVGVRNLGERQNHKLSRMIAELERLRNTGMN